MTYLVYTKDNCVNCDRTKKYLSANNIDFMEQAITPGIREWAIQQGMQQAPIVAGDGELFCGWQPDRLKKIKEKNQ